MRKSKDQYYLDIAYEVSKRSSCLKRHYGCILVKNDEIISTGYNGAPRGDDNCCDIYSICPRIDVPHNSGNYDKCHSVHAEMNAIISASRSEMLGSIMYLSGEEYDVNLKEYVRLSSCEPCPICSRLITNAGISRVIRE